MAKGPQAGGKRKSDASPSSASKRRSSICVEGQVNQRLREAFKQLTHEEKFVRIDAATGLSLSERLARDLAANPPIRFSYLQNQVLKRIYRSPDSVDTLLTMREGDMDHTIVEARANSCDIRFNSQVMSYSIHK